MNGLIAFALKQRVIMVVLFTATLISDLRDHESRSVLSTGIRAGAPPTCTVQFLNHPDH